MGLLFGCAGNADEIEQESTSQIKEATGKITAGSVLEVMNHAERNIYYFGIVEGLAYARFLKDDKETDGMACIYDWYLGQEKFTDAPDAILEIEEASIRYKDHTPGAVVGALTRMRCPE
ncbi:hypothetical protein DX908_02650 [Parvularcula marina]|uniref:Rap1a immunity protein domain-containing protein n=2 Tax=Parvularcula marina TaxID=2292771 RepID=A0A371RFP8_9PROT|nr:hypothetical protein DX908_02650 [Parvularcula marina]